MIDIFGQWGWRTRRKASMVQCDWCGEGIVHGERYAHYFGFSEEEWQYPFAANMHEECHEVMTRDGWDEWEPWAQRPEKGQHVPEKGVLRV